MGNEGQVIYMTLHPCRQPGCPELVSKGGYCDRHKRDIRPNIRDRGYTSLWDKVSKRHKALHPLCEDCLEEGKVSVNQVSHHIIPEQLCMKIGRKDLIYDMNNLRGQCAKHHALKATVDTLWFKFAETDNMQGTAKEIHERFGEWNRTGGGGKIPKY
jgi:5-methylcytosine-specific restriction protein A